MEIMKKVFGLLLVFSCCTGVTGDLLAANECSGEKSITMSSQKKWDDEFLYYDQNTYDSVPDKNETQSELPNFVYECDRQKCGNESEVTLPKGHVFRGSTINESRTYVCRAAFMGDDRWVVKSVEGVETTVSKPKETYEVKCEDNYAINLKGNQRKHDDEFLYENKSAYDMVIDHNNKYQQNLPGKVYECDKQICANGFEVDMEANHVFKGQVVKEKTTYVCDAKGNNMWVVKAAKGNNGGGNGGDNSQDQKGCGINFMKLSGVQHIYDDEFLYANQTTYNSVSDKNGEYTGLPGKVYECDNEYCASGQDIYMPAGHVFKGSVVNVGKTYECKANFMGDDRWVEKSFGPTCGEVHMSFDGNQKPADNEFLYSTHEAYLEADRKWGNDSLDLSGVGEVFECDDDHCKKGTIKKMTKGHSFGGQKINEDVTYECKLNRWVRVGSESCQFAGVNIAVDEWYTDTNGTKIPVSYNDCHQFADGNPVNKNDMFNVKCERVNGLLKNVCHKIGASDDSKLKDCLAKRTTPEGKACCYLAESVAKFENGQCVCSGGKTFRMDKNGRGICTGGNGGDEGDEGDDLIPVTQCVTVLNELSLFVKTNCVSLSTKVESLMELCMSGYLTVAMWNSQSSVIRNSCLNQQESPKEKLVAAAEKLDTIFAGFKVSKWKNEEGKFNTARLASDSIAGVVLGTTGGLITSSVMKKKQVEQGFEDLQCVVGGQPVAGWGDEFMVGIQ